MEGGKILRIIIVGEGREGGVSRLAKLLDDLWMCLSHEKRGSLFQFYAKSVDPSFPGLPRQQQTARFILGFMHVVRCPAPRTKCTTRVATFSASQGLKSIGPRFGVRGKTYKTVGMWLWLPL